MGVRGAEPRIPDATPVPVPIVVTPRSVPAAEAASNNDRRKVTDTTKGKRVV